MLLIRRNTLPLICGLVVGALVVHLVHLTTRSVKQVAEQLRTIPAPENLPTARLNQPCSSQVTSLQSSDSRSDFPTRLFKQVRILCLIMTHPANYNTKAVAVNNTWVRRCNKYAFVGSDASTITIPLIHLNIKESRNALWQKTWMSLEYAVKNFNMNEFDFVLKADDDTFAVMENLRLLLLPLNPNEASFIGRRFRYNGDPKLPYMSGGAGYVLSRQAIRLFVQRAILGKGDPCRKQFSYSEDFMLGTCLSQMGVKFIDSRDSKGLERFHPLSTDYMIGRGPAPVPPWMQTFNYFPFKSCVKGCISSSSATFHYIALQEMYKLEFLLYGMRPFGVDPNGTVS